MTHSPTGARVVRVDGDDEPVQRAGAVVEVLRLRPLSEGLQARDVVMRDGAEATLKFVQLGRCALDRFDFVAMKRDDADIQRDIDPIAVDLHSAFEALSVAKDDGIGERGGDDEGEATERSQDEDDTFHKNKSSGRSRRSPHPRKGASGLRNLFCRNGGEEAVCARCLQAACRTPPVEALSPAL